MNRSQYKDLDRNEIGGWHPTCYLQFSAVREEADRPGSQNLRWQLS